jgi:hypothetical protein
MIQLYNGASLLGSYATSELWETDFLASETRGNEYQPPGSYESVVEGDGVDIATPFLIPFRLNYNGNAARVGYEMVALRNRLHLATSLYETEYGLWRALQNGRDAVKYFSPRPESDVILDAAIIRAKLRPKFGRWTIDQAETTNAYLAVRDSVPFSLSNEPFTDGSFWSDGGGWSG